jgi:crotonobetainyl-CoA:carnitine CoA-transferase CaiB-like acyl-CoA transferase
VIKVERPDVGDETREWAPPFDADGNATYFQALNRNKRSITLEFGDDDDRRLAVELATRADIVIENFRPGTLDRFGLGFDQLRSVNPKLIYCSITGFGSATAEAAEMSGYDLLLQATSGLMSITGQRDGEPTKVGVALVDHITALQATIGILAALAARFQTGVGQRVEVSLMSAALAALTNQASGYLGAGVVPMRLGNRHPSIAPYQPFRAADGWFVIACGNDVQFGRLAKAIGSPELVDDNRFVTNADRVAHVGELEELLNAMFAAGSVDHWVRLLNAQGVASGPINDVGQAFAMAESLGVAPIVISDFDGHTERTVRSPLGLSATPVSVRRNCPAHGEHNEEIRRWLSSRSH